MTTLMLSKQGLFGLMAAAADVRAVPVAPWRWHAAVRWLREGADVTSSLAGALREIEFVPDPDVGLKAAGVTTTIHDLIRTGALLPEDSTPVRQLCVAKSWTGAYLQMLELMNPADRVLLRQAGELWAASRPTSSKSPVRSEPASSEAQTTSGTPNRLHPVG